MKHTHILAAAALVAGLAACADMTGPSGSVSGRYVLQTVNGSYLPYGLGQDQTGAYVDIVADTLWVDPGGTYQEAVYYANTYGSGGTTIDSQLEEGTWSANNGAIQFYDRTDGGITYNGSVSGTTLTEINQGYTQVYSRR